MSEAPTIVHLLEHRIAAGSRRPVLRSVKTGGVAPSREPRSAKPKWTWWLRADAAIARRITPAGVLIGRSPRCDIVVPSELAGRCQALIYLTDKGPRLEVLGRAKTKVQGKLVARFADLAPGDRIELAGAELEIGREVYDAPKSTRRAPVWVLEAPTGALFGMGRWPFSVGGGQDDDLRVEGWPEGALSFRVLDDGHLELTPSMEVWLDGEPCAAGKPTLVGRGTLVALGGTWVRVLTGGTLARGGAAGNTTSGVKAVRLEFLPRGGRLRLEWSSGDERAVYLADRRCDLVAALLQPPTPHAPGDFLDDELLLGRIWHSGSAGRTNLNVLLHRVRKDLARAGLGEALIERCKGGGATRFVLCPGARVEVA